MPPFRGRLQARLRPSSCLFLSFAPLSVILATLARIQRRCFCRCLSSFCHPRRLVIDDPVSPTLIGDPLSVILAHARIQCRSLRKDRKKQRPWIPDRVGDDRREKTAPSNGATSRAPAGAAAPQSRIFFEGEDCLSEALVLSNAKELSIKNRALGKADSFLRQTQDRREILRFAQDKLGMTTERHPKGRAWAPMVLDPFAETKGSRRAGAKPRKVHSTPFHHSVPDKPDDWNDHSCIGRATHRMQKKQREKG